jgi:hypothetical protein
LHLDSAEKVVSFHALLVWLVVGPNVREKDAEDDTRQGLALVIGEPSCIHRVSREGQQIRCLSTNDLNDASMLCRRQRLRRTVHEPSG